MSERADDLDMSSWEEELETYQARNNLLIVDGLNLSFRWKQRGASLNKPVNFSAGLVSTINSLAKSYGAREVVFLSDYKGSAYRKSIHPKYKSDRKKQFANQSPEEEAANDAFFKYYREVAVPLAAKNFHLIECEGVEADDLAGYIVEQFEDGKHFDHIWMISTDGDWDELISENCSRFSTTTRKEYKISDYYDLKGCDTPEQFTHMKAIMGDLGDSVYGVSGIGVKRAYNLIREYGDVYNLIEHLPLSGKQLFIKALNESADLMLLNLQLVDIRTFYMEAIAAGSQDNFEKLQRITEELMNV